MNGVDCCDADSISEKEIQNFVVRAINNMIGSRNELLEHLKNNVEEIFDFDVLGIDKIDKKMDELQVRLEDCIYHNKDFTDILKEIDRLKALKDNVDIQQYNNQKERNSVNQIKNFIERQSTFLSEYDEEIVSKLVEKIVLDNTEITVIFKTGNSITMKRFVK